MGRWAGWVVAAVLLWARSATAYESPRSSLFASRSLALEGHLGIGTPVGFFGGFVDYALFESVTVGAGAGAGSGPDYLSLHLAAGARWRALRGELNAGYLAVEYSTGGYREFQSYALAPSGVAETWTVTDITAERAHWLHLSLGWEHRWRSGVVLRAYYGAGILLNPDDRECISRTYDSGELTETRPCEPASETTVPFFGLAVGYAFRGP